MVGIGRIIRYTIWLCAHTRNLEVLWTSGFGQVTWLSWWSTAKEKKCANGRNMSKGIICAQCMHVRNRSNSATSWSCGCKGIYFPSSCSQSIEQVAASVGRKMERNKDAAEFTQGERPKLPSFFFLPFSLFLKRSSKCNLLSLK